MLFSSRISLLPFILYRILLSVDRAHHTSPHAILIPYIALTIHTIPHPAFSGQSTSHLPPCYSHPVYRSYHSYYTASCFQWTEHITPPPMLFSSRISLLPFILSCTLPSVDRSHHTSPHAILIPYIAVKIHSIPHPAFSGQSTSHFPPYYSHPVYRTYNSYYPASCLQWTEHITPSLHAFLIPYIALTIHTILHPAFSGQSTSHFPPPPPQCYSHPVSRSYHSYYPASCLRWTEHITFPPMLFSSRISLLPFILNSILPSVDRAHHAFPHTVSHPVSRSYNSYYPASCLQKRTHPIFCNAVLINDNLEELSRNNGKILKAKRLFNTPDTSLAMNGRREGGGGG